MLRIPTRPSELVELARTLYANRLARFLAVGGTCGVIQLSILHALVAARGVEAHLANLIAFIVSMELNFALNQSFTWRDRWSSSLSIKRIIGRLLLFNVSASMTAGAMNQGVFALMNLFIWYLPAAAIGICVAAFANFLLNDRLVFRLRQSREAVARTVELDH